MRSCFHRFLFSRIFLPALLATGVISVGSQHGVAQILTPPQYGVLFETWTNSFSPYGNAYSQYTSQVNSTLSSDASEIIHLDEHVSNIGDRMSQAATGSQQSYNEVLGPTNVIFISSVNRQPAFSEIATSPRVTNVQSDWESEISSQAGNQRSADIDVDSAFFDTTTSTFYAYLVVRSDVQFSNTVGIRYAIVQDGVPFMDDSLGGSRTIVSHKDVVRYITSTDSVLNLKGKPAGTVVHAMYRQTIEQLNGTGTQVDKSFIPANMRFIAFIQETPSDPTQFFVSTTAQLIKNLANLPPPSKSLLLSDNGLDGFTYSPGQTITPSWFKVNIPTVLLSYSFDNGNTWFGMATKSDKSFPDEYYWNAPDTPTTKGKIKVSDPASGVESIEPGNFTITAPTQALQLLNPPIATQGGDTNKYKPGTMIPIKWTETGVDTVDVLFSITDGESWDTLKSDLFDGGGDTSFIWTVPDSLTLQGRIEVVPVSVSEKLVPASRSWVFKIISSGIGVGTTPTLPLGISELSIYPNPSSDNSTIHLGFTLGETETIQLEIYDVLGKEVQHSTLHQLPAGTVKLPINTSTFGTGSYIARVQGANGIVASTKFELER